MAKDRLPDKLAVILHADVAGSTHLVQQDEHLAHERIQDSFHRFGDTIEKYRGTILELRGDALLAEFERASDAVSATLAFQSDQAYYLSRLKDELKPNIRVGIAMGEVVIGDGTVTGAGVVLAQRVEQLADPGSLCITAALHEALPNRMPFDLESIGEQSLKGFDEPVRVYRVELRPGESIPPPQLESQLKSSQKSWQLKTTVAVIVVVIAIGTTYLFKSTTPIEEAASIERMAFPLPDKPSIAVLPFNNMSDDPQQDFFADGMTEDLITDISKISSLFVIARNSVFAYKDKAVKVRQVAEELGVRYVMEGSVRRVGNQVRINAQLIDATTGGHIWAERYDGSLNDVFEMQDKITEKIVVALSLTLGDQQEIQVETSNTEAYDAYLRGWERYRLGTPEDIAKSVAYFEQAIRLDPDFARAHSAVAAAHWIIVLNGWSRSIDLPLFQAREESRLTLKKAMEQPSALTYQIASERAAYFQRKPDKALAEAERAITLDANDPASHLAMATALLKAKKPDEAEKSVRTAMRLDPHSPASYFTKLGQIQYAMGQYEKAAETLETAIKRNPEDDWTFIYLAATYGQLGHEDEATRAVEKANALRAKSGWGALTMQTVGTHRDMGGRRYYFKWFSDYKPLREGLRKAGVMPEVNWSSLINSGSSGFEIQGARTIDIKTAKALYERGVPFISMHFSWVQGRIPGAHYLDMFYYEFNEVRLAEIVSNAQEVVIYASQSNNRTAAQAVARSVTWGFKKVNYFRDGLDGWKAAGYPVETDKK
ncbi:tetratricopeptide repeat protein [Pseudomonadota bacterium]|jgi:TolB-like protein/class 3 adenylate cyclase